MTLVHVDPSDSAQMMREEVDLSTLTLEELAERANVEHGLAEAALTKAMEHVFRVGEALYAARCRVGRHGWRDWQAEHLDISPAWTSAYMRAAVYRDRVTVAGAKTLTEARAVTTGLPPMFPSAPVRYSDDMKAEARRLAEAGYTPKEIAAMLGIAKNTVHCYIDDEYDRRHRQNQKRSQQRRYAARRALREQQEREERDCLAREKGGNLGKAYDAVRKLQPIIDGAVAEGLSVEARALAVRLEDEIFKALKR